MGFIRKSMEQITQSMTDWSRGVSGRLTDFRVGSKIRTIYEAVALELEAYYDKVFQNIRQLIAENLYTVMGFSKRPAIYAYGNVVFGRSTPADTNYLIPAGTIVTTQATSSMAPIQYRTSVDAIIATGQTSVTVQVVCMASGTIGNAPANAINQFVTKPSGVDTVSNTNAFANGLNDETLDEQKVRFQKFIQSLMRGTVASVEYGALISQVVDANGNVTERVLASKATEDLVNYRGIVSVYVWNGIGSASSALTNAVQTTLTGYYDTVTGEAVYGYKPAGILANIYSATAKPVKIRLNLTFTSGFNLSMLQTSIEQIITDFGNALQLGQTFIVSQLQGKISALQGVSDVTLNVSTDNGATYSTSNVTTQATEVVQIVFPINYVTS